MYISKANCVKAEKLKTPTVISAVLNIPLKSDDSTKNIQQLAELKPKDRQDIVREKNEIQDDMDNAIKEAEVKFQRT